MPAHEIARWTLLDTVVPAGSATTVSSYPPEHDEASTGNEYTDMQLDPPDGRSLAAIVYSTEDRTPIKIFVPPKSNSCGPTFISDYQWELVFPHGCRYTLAENTHVIVSSLPNDVLLERQLSPNKVNETIRFMYGKQHSGTLAIINTKPNDSGRPNILPVASNFPPINIRDANGSLYRWTDSNCELALIIDNTGYARLPSYHPSRQRLLTDYCSRNTTSIERKSKRSNEVAGNHSNVPVKRTHQKEILEFLKPTGQSGRPGGLLQSLRDKSIPTGRGKFALKKKAL